MASSNFSVNDSDEGQTRKILARNIPSTTSYRRLMDILLIAGPVVDLQLTFSEEEPFLGTARVTFRTSLSVNYALASLDGLTIRGVPLDLSPIFEEEEQEQDEEEVSPSESSSPPSSRMASVSSRSSPGGYPSPPPPPPPSPPALEYEADDEEEEQEWSDEELEGLEVLEDLEELESENEEFLDFNDAWGFFECPCITCARRRG